MWQPVWGPRGQGTGPEGSVENYFAWPPALEPHGHHVQGPAPRLQKARGIASGRGGGGGYGKGEMKRGAAEPPTSETPFITWTGCAGRTGADACFILPSSAYFSLCSGTLTSTGMATSHRKSSRSSVGTSLTSAPLGTSTRTSEEGWGLGEREGRDSLPLGFQLPPVQEEAIEPDHLGRGSYQNVGRGSYLRGRLPAVEA